MLGAPETVDLHLLLHGHQAGDEHRLPVRVSVPPGHQPRPRDHTHRGRAARVGPLSGRGRHAGDRGLGRTRRSPPSRTADGADPVRSRSGLDRGHGSAGRCVRRIRVDRLRQAGLRCEHAGLPGRAHPVRTPGTGPIDPRADMVGGLAGRGTRRRVADRPLRLAGALLGTGRLRGGGAGVAPMDRGARPAT